MRNLQIVALLLLLLPAPVLAAPEAGLPLPDFAIGVWEAKSTVPEGFVGLVPLGPDSSEATRIAREIRNEGGHPVLHLRATLPVPSDPTQEPPGLTSFLARATAQARELKEVAAGYLLDLDPEKGGGPERGYLVKRAATALKAGWPEAQVFLGPVGLEELEALYAAGIAPYTDGVVTIVEPEELEAVRGVVLRRDVTARLWSFPAADRSVPEALVDVLAAGGDGLLVRESSRALVRFEAALPESFSVVGAELAEGEEGAGLRVASAPEGARLEVARILDLETRRVLLLASPAEGSTSGSARVSVNLVTEGSPRLTDFATGEGISPGRAAKDPRAGLTHFEIPVEPGQVVQINLRPKGGAAGLPPVEELAVRGEALPPVEEILARYQEWAAEQDDRLESYIATVFTDMTFSPAGTTRKVTLGLRSRLYVRDGEEPEWESLEVFLNGAPYTAGDLPNIPFVQPEKVRILPLDIHLGKTYRYELAGRERVGGRDAYQVRFEPSEEMTGPSFRGEVWIDAASWERLRMRVVQVGLAPPIVSYESVEETGPVGAEGGEVLLPRRLDGSQIFTSLGAAVTVQLAVNYEEYALNPDDFEERREAARGSDRQMMRDTEEEGFRYLVKDPETGERVESAGDTRGRFWIAGLAYDDSVDYPIPLGGVNLLYLETEERPYQANLFLAGAYNNVTLSLDSLGGSKWSGAVDASVVAIRRFDRLLGADGYEDEDARVRVRTQRVGADVGRGVGRYGRFGAGLDLTYTDFSDDDETADSYRLPENHLAALLDLDFQFTRSGWVGKLWGQAGHRFSWEEWGDPAAPGDPADKSEDYLKYGVGVSREWNLGGFRIVGFSLDWMGGRDLDRFSRYRAGFGDSELLGFSGTGLRWDEGSVLRLRVGWNILEKTGVEFRSDIGYLRDRSIRPHYEETLGVGVSGSIAGPYGTIWNFEVGYGVEAGPAPEVEGTVGARILLMKLF